MKLQVNEETYMFLMYTVRTMSADGGHFEPRSGSLNTILEVDHLRTIEEHVCYIGLLVSEEKILKHFFPYAQC